MQNTNTPSTAAQNEAGAVAAPVEKAFIAFFSRKEDKEPKVEIYRSLSQAARAPLFAGKIGEKQVSMFLRHGTNGPFLGLVGEKIAEGRYEDLGTANVVTARGGAPRLVIKMGEQRIFCSVSMKLDDAMLERLGLNLELQKSKREEAAKAAESTASAAAPEGAIA